MKNFPSDGPMMALVLMLTMALCAVAIADIVYFDSGESIEVEAGTLYLSEKPLYTAQGSLKNRLTIKRAQPLEAPETQQEQCVEPGELGFGPSEECEEEDGDGLGFGHEG